MAGVGVCVCVCLSVCLCLAMNAFPHAAIFAKRNTTASEAPAEPAHWEHLRWVTARDKRVSLAVFAYSLVWLLLDHARQPWTSNFASINARQTADPSAKPSVYLMMRLSAAVSPDAWDAEAASLSMLMSTSLTYWSMIIIHCTAALSGPGIQSSSQLVTFIFTLGHLLATSCCLLPDKSSVGSFAFAPELWLNEPIEGNINFLVLNKSATNVQ